MYPNPRVGGFIAGQFVTLRVHIKEQPTMWHRFAVRWTPTVLILAADGRELRRIEGFLPADPLLGQVQLGLAFGFVAEKEWAEAEEQFEQVVRDYPDTDAAPEAQYWAGVAKYSGTHDKTALVETRRRFAERYRHTDWAKRTLIWAG